MCIRGNFPEKIRCVLDTHCRTFDIYIFLSRTEGANVPVRYDIGSEANASIAMEFVTDLTLAVVSYVEYLKFDVL